MRRVYLLCCVCMSACIIVPTHTTPTPPPVSPVVNALRAVSVYVYDDDGNAVADATCSLDGVTDQRALANADGYVLWLNVPASLRATQLTCDAADFVAFSEHRDLTTNADEWITPNATMHATHADPSRWTAQALLHVRGSLFTVRADHCDLPYGPRPHQRDNVAFFAAPFYTKDQRECVYQLWKEHGYTHGAVGPFIDPGYHGEVPPIDFRTDNGEQAADLIQEVWDHDLVPVVFVTPDGWTVPQLQTLAPIFTSPRWQRLIRVVVNGFEQQGDVYGWSNNTYVGHLTWLRDTFPHALRGLHTIANIESPVGDNDQTKRELCTNDQLARGKCFDGNGDAWSRVVPLIHFWLNQTDALFHPQHVDPSGDGRTDEAHWYDLWDRTNAGSFMRRFESGASGWPTTSANTADVNGGHLCVVAGEFLSYVVYWDPAHFTEDMARNYGARAVTLGACGAMDGVR